MKKILINCRDINKKGGGTGIYVQQLVKELDKLNNINTEFKIFILSSEKIKLHNCHLILKKNKNNFLFDFIFMAYYAIKYEIDVLIGTKYFVPYLPNKKKIAVIHDLAYFKPETNAYTLTNRLVMTSLLKLTSIYTDVFITDSNSTKNDLFKYLGKNKKVYTIYLGPGQIKKRKTKNNNKSYLLFTGGITPRKNLSRIIEAISLLKINIKLNLTGSRGWSNKAIKKTINANKNIVKLGYVDQNELDKLYSNASIFLYPSLYEGFGLPILEAQAAGVPVITSNVSSMPEVAGEGAYYVNPESVNEIKEAIIRLLDDDKLRLELISKGYDNLKRFSWKKNATELINIAME